MGNVRDTDVISVWAFGLSKVYCIKTFNFASIEKKRKLVVLLFITN